MTRCRAERCFAKCYWLLGWLSQSLAWGKSPWWVEWVDSQEPLPLRFLRPRWVEWVASQGSLSLRCLFCLPLAGCLGLQGSGQCPSDLRRLYPVVQETVFHFSMRHRPLQHSKQEEKVGMWTMSCTQDDFHKGLVGEGPALESWPQIPSE